jgi:hypothetical protein
MDTTPSLRPLSLIQTRQVLGFRSNGLAFGREQGPKSLVGLAASKVRNDETHLDSAPRSRGRKVLDFVPCLFLSLGMTLLLRKSSAQARIEGWDPRNRSDDDYAVVDDTIVGRICREMILGKPKWRWFLQQIPEAGPGRPIRPPNQGMADTLDEAKAAFEKRYQEVRRRK